MSYSWFLFVFLLGCTSIIIGSPIVHIGRSTIKGQIVYKGAVEAEQFLGIPYAQPPIGDLRFKPTKPLPKLPETINAIHQPPACHQYTKNPYPWYANTTIQSEDCLYLNIWSPVDAYPNNTKPVLFWIHGGSFRFGSIRQGVYDGIKLAGIGDIVVVTVNYRLGPFGFMTSSTEDAPGNAGLWDILEGLRWVHRHIRAFGGDPDMVTLAGESAGSVAVALLSISPQARGLFPRQIMESGSPAVLGLDGARSKNLRMTQKLAGLVGCANESYSIHDHPAEVVECLKGVDEMSITYADQYVSSTHRSFRPQEGDEIIPVNPRDAIANGQFECKELLIGNNRDEGSALMTINNADTFGFLGEKKTLITKEKGKEILRNYLTSFPDPEALADHYLPDDLSSPVDIRRQVYTAIGDAGVLCPSVFVAEKCAEKEGRVYYYFWEHQSEVTPWALWMGVTHYTEVNFVFGTPPLLGFEERQHSLQLIQLWSNFVKYGTPTFRDLYFRGSPSTTQFWPVFSRDFPHFTVLPRQPFGGGHYGRGPHLDNCNFLRPYYGF